MVSSADRHWLIGGGAISFCTGVAEDSSDDSKRAVVVALVAVVAFKETIGTLVDEEVGSGVISVQGSMSERLNGISKSDCEFLSTVHIVD